MSSESIHIDLGSPEPRVKELPFVEHEYDRMDKIQLPEPSPLPQVDLAQLLVSRRTRYSGTALRHSLLSPLLHYSARVIQTASLDSGFAVRRKPVMSAGGRHPIDILVIETTPEGQDVFLYNDEEHSLSRINVCRENVQKLFDEASEAAQGAQSTLLCFAGQVGRTSSKYHRPGSLLWRDAGALLQQLSLVSAALGLSCIPVGPTGEPYASSMLKSDGRVVAFGGCFVGSLQA